MAEGPILSPELGLERVWRPASWPPVDIVVVDLSTGFVVKRWHEGGDEAAGLLRISNDDLITMPRDEFIEKWDVPSA